MTPEQLKAWRDHMQWTQQQAADKLGITVKNYWAHEAGHSKLGIPTTIALACAALANHLRPWGDTGVIQTKPVASESTP